MSLIDEMKAYAEREGLPILRDSEVPLFESIIANKRPGKVLEIGTCIGYSALRMAPFLGDGGTITTVEFDKARCKRPKTLSTVRLIRTSSRPSWETGRNFLKPSRVPGTWSFSTGPRDSTSASFGSSCRNLCPEPLSWPTTSAIMKCFTSKHLPHKHRTAISRLREFMALIEDRLILKRCFLKMETA